MIVRREDICNQSDRAYRNNLFIAFVLALMMDTFVLCNTDVQHYNNFIHDY